MKKMNAYYLAALICLVILAIAGSYFVYHAYFPPDDLRQNQQQDPGRTPRPTAEITTPVPPASSTVPVPGSTQDNGSICNPQSAGSRVPVPVDTSIPIRDPMPGIRYSLNGSESGRTIVIGKGDIFEITLGFAPGLAMRWTVPVSGCGLELMNDGTYFSGGDLWNNTGFYRARYRAVSPGTSIINGKLVFIPSEDPTGAPRFNLTVIVKQS